MITFQKYVKAETLEEAYTLNQNKNNKIIGGMLWLRLGKTNYNTVIDISGLGLNEIKETDEEYKIGAMVSLRDLETNESLNAYTKGAINNALKDIVGVQFRNLATVGGSIYGRFGFSDVLTVFLSLDSYVELYKGGIVSLDEYSKMKYDKDIVVNLIVKKTPVKVSYDTVRIQRTDFPVLTCAVSKLEKKIKVVIGARPNRARVYFDDENILSDEMTEEQIEKFSEKLSEIVPTGSNNRGSKEYRSHLVKVLVKRNLKRIGGIE